MCISIKVESFDCPDTVFLRFLYLYIFCSFCSSTREWKSGEIRAHALCDNKEVDGVDVTEWSRGLHNITLFTLLQVSCSSASGGRDAIICFKSLI